MYPLNLSLCHKTRLRMLNAHLRSIGRLAQPMDLRLGRFCRALCHCQLLPTFLRRRLRCGGDCLNSTHLTHQLLDAALVMVERSLSRVRPLLRRLPGGCSSSGRNRVVLRSMQNDRWRPGCMLTLRRKRAPREDRWT